MAAPFNLIGEEVDIRFTKTMMEVFFHGSRIALHKREPKQLRNLVTQPEHMLMEHRKYLSYNVDEFIRWTQLVSQFTVKVVDDVLSAGTEPVFGVCFGIAVYIEETLIF